MIKGPHTIQTFDLTRPVPNVLTQLPSNIIVNVASEFDHYLTVVAPSVSVVFTAINNDGSTTLIASENHTLNNIPGIIGVGIPQLRQRSSDLTGFNQGIATNWAAYTIRISGSGFDRTFRFDLDRINRSWDVTCFTFINQFGYWDSAEFLALSDQNEISQKNFSETSNTRVGANSVTTTVPNSYGRTVYHQPLLANGIQVTSSRTARTTTHDLETGMWFKELIQSPDVRVQENQAYLPVRVTPTSYRVPTNPTLEGTFELEINYTYEY